MRSFFEWFSQGRHDVRRPWLILGKGPTFAKRNEFDLSNYSIISLNDAAREQRVDVAHAIDLHAIQRSGEAISQNAGVLVMPWHPHIDFKPGSQTLADHAEQVPVLRRLAQEGRLLWYNLSTARDHRPGSPVVMVRYFSAEAALNLLAEAGVRTVRSLGLDGGKQYGQAFEDLSYRLLANSQPTFDLQFKEFARTILRTGIDFGPLDAECPMRVFIGSSESETLAAKVLEYSVKKHTSMTAKVVPLHSAATAIPVPRESLDRARTPFSLQRFIVPELTNWTGRAVYMDSDMLVMRDLRPLWQIPMQGAQVLCADTDRVPDAKAQFSLMVLDCAALDWRIHDIVKGLDEGRLTCEGLVHRLSIVSRIRKDLEPCWNSIDHYRRGETAVLHYTDMGIQPWLSADNRLGYLWMEALLEAVKAGFISTDCVRQQVHAGWVRPSLLWQLDHGEPDTLAMPRRIRALDRTFVPPAAKAQGKKPRRSPAHVAKTAVLRTLHRSWVRRIGRVVRVLRSR